jgi:hypothetical protein
LNRLALRTAASASLATFKFIGARDDEEEILMKALFWFFCVLSVANGLWMLAAPCSWYLDLPVRVPDTGPFNPHFVRDIGVTFVVLGAGFGWCATNLDRCYPVHLGLTAWFVGHAASVAGLLLTTEAVVAEKPEEKKVTPPTPHPDEF